MIVSLLGTRGSVPIAGPDTVRYGGNTPCVQIEGRSGESLILDAGTGIRRLPSAVYESRSTVHLLLTHLHMDHVQGLGFFQPLFEEGFEVNIWGPPSTTQDLRLRLNRYLSPPLFPTRLRDLPCDLRFHNVPRGTFEVGEFVVTADPVCHPGPTFGYRIEEGSTVVTYLPDHEPALGHDPFPGDPRWTSGYALSLGTDLLIHDTQYSASDYLAHVGWGHSSLVDAMGFAALVGAKRLVTFHHDPANDDETIDRLLEEAVNDRVLPFELIPGIEGTCHQLG